MTRKEQTKKAAVDLAELEQRDFINGAEWADSNPDVNTFKLLESKLALAIEALEKNANEDYRGNRSSASENSFHALKKIRQLPQV